MIAIAIVAERRFVCNETLTVQLAEAGVELVAKSSEIAAISSTGGAESGVLNPDLAAVIAAWPILTPRSRTIMVDFARDALRE